MTVLPDALLLAARKLFDQIAELIASSYQMVELENGIQNIKSDLGSYIAEAVLAGIMGGAAGKKFFEFTNDLYENG